MAITTIVLCCTICVLWVVIPGICFMTEANTSTKVLSIIVAATFFGGWLYQNKTASGRRALVDQRSNFQNGLDRIITVYTADGNQIAQYEGRIDIDSADGYVKFDLDGKRYIYYNCFVECIADLHE